TGTSKMSFEQSIVVTAITLALSALAFLAWHDEEAHARIYRPALYGTVAAWLALCALDMTYTFGGHAQWMADHDAISKAIDAQTDEIEQEKNKIETFSELTSEHFRSINRGIQPLSFHLSTDDTRSFLPNWAWPCALLFILGQGVIGVVADVRTR